MDGEFKGSIESDSLITIGKPGVVEGEINAQKLIVTGRFHGVANCEEIEILSSGQVSGEIYSKVLVIERGSLFEGKSRLKGAETVAATAKPSNVVDAPKNAAKDAKSNVAPLSTPSHLPEPKPQTA
ncbi:bactofilin family protein [Magnetofaba australis]|uniref:Putative Integral membrane protein CcmA involved in cell shape determination n=1 Tax=Magnetofaba australis IT-1 TaxID=1434232 RepID=A0A1Y2K8X5_9PROT|nr:polymer-forming cytoskeletal protein [Magnetofaba australis]OSM05136.1 putative Integral membrane protein CcmA involved in cell shape determination [Magnetofaba australis IT-1]